MTPGKPLALHPQFARPDEAYAMIAQAHRGLDAGQSAALNARLVLILANQIGDEEILRQALALAQETG